jgi:hypothetical protein
MHAGLTAAERRQLGELQPQIEALEKELSQAKKAAGQVSQAQEPLTTYTSTRLAAWLVATCVQAT